MLTGNQLRGELLRVAGIEADQRLVEAVDQLTGADLVREAGGCRLLDRLAVDGRGQVDGHEVAVLHGALDASEGAEALPQREELLGDVFVVDLDGVYGDGDGGEVGQFDFGADVDLGGERQLLTVLDLGDLDVRLADDVHLGGGNRLAVAAGQRVVDDLLEDRAAADPGLEQLGRRLARAEAGDADLLGEGLVSAVEFGLELREGHLNVDPDSRRAQLLDGALHGRTPLCCCYRVACLGDEFVVSGRGDRI